jgi:putative hydrolase of the HAD superfamily
VIDADMVLLDLYDTVADGAWGDLAAIVMDRLGIDRETLFRAFDETRPARSVGAFGSAEGDLAAVIAATGVETDERTIRELVAMELETLPQRARRYEDSLPVVAALRANGIRTVLISNCSHSTRPIVDALGLPAAFDEIALSFEVGAAKPDPEIYRAALELGGGGPPDRAVFVDDQVGYCDGAAALGIRTFLIVRDEADPMEGKPSDANGHRVIRDLRALLD